MTGSVVPPNAQTAGQPQGQADGQNSGQNAGQQGAGQQQQPQNGGQQSGQAQGPQNGQQDRGFPENTPWREMNPEQQVAYWQYQSRRHEGHVQQLTGGRDFSAVQADLQELSQYRQERQTPAEQQIAAAREEGRREAAAAANSSVVSGLVQANLHARGWSDQDIADHLTTLNTSAFVADGQVDTAKVLGHVNRIAGSDPGSGNTQRLDMGQGPRGQRNTATGVAAGRAMFEASRPTSKTS